MLADCEDQPPPQCMSCSVGADHMKWNSPQQGLVPASISLWMYCLCVGFGASWEGFWYRSECLRDWPLAICLGLQSDPVCGGLCWAWVCVGRAKPVHQGQGPPAPCLGAGQQKAQGTPRSVSICWLPLRLSHRKSLWLYASHVM